MYSRLKGKGIVLTLFVIISILYYETSLNDALIVRPVMKEIIDVTNVIKTSGNATLIAQGLKEIDQLQEEIKDTTEEMYGAFDWIYILCFFNLMFFVA